MDEQKRHRIIILAVSLAMLGAGVFGYMHYSNQQSENAETDLAAMEQTGKPASPMATVNNNAGGTQPEGAAPAGTTPAPAAAPAATPVASTPPATTPAATPAADATTPAATPVAAQPVKPAATQPAATTPPVATTPPPVASTPPAPAAPAKPLAAATPTQTPIIASAPPTPVATPPAATAPASTPAAAAQPPAAEPANPNAVGVEKLKKRFPSMKRDTLVAEAKQAAGRQDPMMPYMGTSPFPYYSKGSAAAEDEENKEKKEAIKVPPPPPIAKAPKTPRDLVPPPPPSDPSLAGAGGMAGLPLNELPQAPDKPTVADKLKLAAVIGNKVILNVPYAVRAQNKWPATISLAPGEQFESLSVVSVDGDSVTIDEDGERTVKTLASIK